MENDIICNNNCVMKADNCVIGFGKTKRYDDNDNEIHGYCNFYFQEKKKNVLLSKIGNIPYIPITDINYGNIELIKVKNDKYILADSIKNIFTDNMISYLYHGLNIWLYGATGTGKTTIAFSLAYDFWKIYSNFEYIDCFKYEDISTINPEKCNKNNGVTLIDEMYLNEQNEKLLLKYIDWKKYGTNPIIFTSNYLPFEIAGVKSGYALKDARIIDRLQLIPILIVCKKSYRSLQNENI